MSEIPHVKTTRFDSLDEQGISEHDQALEKQGFSGHRKMNCIFLVNHTPPALAGGS